MSAGRTVAEPLVATGVRRAVAEIRTELGRVERAVAEDDVMLVLHAVQEIRQWAESAVEVILDA